LRWAEFTTVGARVKERIDESSQEAFEGAKPALFLALWLLAFEWDGSPRIAGPGPLDLPGGGEKGTKGLVASALRESFESVGADVACQGSGMQPLLRSAGVDLVRCRIFGG